MMQAVYDVAGLAVCVDTDGPRVAEAVARRFRHFAPVDVGSAPDLTLVVRAGESPSSTWRAARRRGGRPIYDAPPHGTVLYDEASDVLALDYGGRAGLVVEPRSARAEVWAAPDRQGVWLASHPLLTLALAELLKRRGRFALHAAAMTPSPPTVLLLAGGSGAGKTTLAIALGRAGWGFLADDTVFLRPERDSPLVVGFADELDVTDETAALFPDLDLSTSASPAPWRAKRAVLVDEALGAQPEPAGRPAALVLPAVAAGTKSVLTPVDAGHALTVLAPNVVLTDPASSQRHLDALASLVSSVPCWRLEAGLDFDEVAGTLEHLVAAAARR